MSGTVPTELAQLAQLTLLEFDHRTERHHPLCLGALTPSPSSTSTTTPSFVAPSPRTSAASPPSDTLTPPPTNSPTPTPPRRNNTPTTSGPRPAAAPVAAPPRRRHLPRPPTHQLPAFADGARHALTNPNTCVACSGNETAYVALLIVVALAALVALALFARHSVRHPHERKRGVSSVLLLVTHAQALSLLGYLRLDWPPAVRWLIDDVLSLNLFNVPAATCVFGSPHSFEALTLLGSSASSAYTLSSLDVYAFAAIGAPPHCSLS